MSRAKDQAKQQRREAMLAALAEQLSSPETPEVKQHYDRLIQLGLSDPKVRELIATVLAFYFWHAMRNDGYGYADYLTELSKLPEIDWSDDGDVDDDQRA